MKTCATCKQSKPFTEFYTSKTRGYQSRCIACMKSPEHRARRRQYYKNGGKERHMLRTYGLTAEEYQVMVEKQGGRCPICRTKGPLVVDHCHSTQKVRGLLCDDCNKGMGILGDSTKRLERAIQYLNQRKELQ